MKKETFHLFFLFIFLVFLQVWLFGNIHLFTFATPLLYVYFLIKLPVYMNRNIVMILYAFMGLIIDIFSGTMGLTMMATTMTGFLRFYLLKLFTPRDLFDNCIPSFATFGKLLFMRYAGSISFIQVCLLFSIESLSLFSPVLLLIRITSSFFLTFLLIFAFESINPEVFNK